MEPVTCITCHQAVRCIDSVDGEEGAEQVFACRSCGTVFRVQAGGILQLSAGTIREYREICMTV